MTTALQMPGFTQTVNAVVIRSTAGLCRPAGIVNKIKALVRVKINENSCCNPKRLGYSLDMKTNRYNVVNGKNGNFNITANAK